ncbi:hypothetical protein [Caldalkalibacillus mannanilyticus]|uniref:hypothetical protein n=1 Tax=Caldalkalibacillus mannanilyticus TaxID=1418 RepID=UPI000B08A0F5|nr:hypothetical protein [Caldalkalibacillus mannanilyticus]
MSRVRKRMYVSWLLMLVLVISSFVPFLQLNGASTVYATEQPSNFSWDNATVYFAMTDRFYDGNSANNNSYGRPQQDAWGKILEHSMEEICKGLQIN